MEVSEARSTVPSTQLSAVAIVLEASDPSPAFLMQPFDKNALLHPVPSLPLATSVVGPPKGKEAIVDHIPASHSESSLTSRRSNPSTASLFSSTLTPPTSRPISPVGSASPIRGSSGSAFDLASGPPLTERFQNSPNEPLSLILKAFVPHVAIYAAEDTDRLAKEKGFSQGLWELLRPFGEDVYGKVTIRDSNGFSHTWEDFSIRLVKFRDAPEHDGVPDAANPQGATTLNSVADTLSSRIERAEQPANDIADTEAVVECHLQYAEESIAGVLQNETGGRVGLDDGSTSPYYALYLRRLLSGIPLAPHETFAHPVACVIAISSRNAAPIDALRKLYDETSRGDQKLPPWVDPEYLRYYVLVHDEERDDIARSMSLFDQMKRHFGLHCHLLRLRSSGSAETDDDSVPHPESHWMTAQEELKRIQRSQRQQDFDDNTRYIFESDATAIQTFIREMVTQSILPTMERHIHTWNDQVASRRRGLSGRFMSLSRRWGGSGTSTTNSNYDSAGFYRPGSPEAVMRKLADFAFMLRDWKLAQSTYDLLRSDFNNDKAWRYHAAANEMAAVSLLMTPQGFSSKSRAEAIGRMLDAAFYSYLTRCGAQYGALRCLLLGLELLRLRGGSYADDAARWGAKLVESKMLGQVGDALIKERVAVCYASRQGIGNQAWGARRRKSALWDILSAEAWISQSKYIQAQRCLNESRRMYAALPSEQGVPTFSAAIEFVGSLQHAVKRGMMPEADEYGNLTEDEEVEVLLDVEIPVDTHRRRRSSILHMPDMVGDAALGTAPLRSGMLTDTEPSSRARATNDEFQ